MREPFTVFMCPTCEWAATTGAPWDVCPHCEKQERAIGLPVVPIAALDAACLGRTAVQSLRRAGNGGRPLKGVTNPGYYVSTHVTADLCQMADVIDALSRERKDTE